MAKWHKGRSRSSEAKHVRHYEWMLSSAAYRSLGIYSRALYTEICRRYNGINNGDIPMSYREAEELLNCSNKPIPGAFRELQEKGFIKPSRRGSFDWKTRVDNTRRLRATTWILTEHPIDLPLYSAMPATKDFMKWRTPEKKARHAESVPLVRSKRAISDPMARRERTSGPPTAGHLTENEPPNGTPKAGTYSIPGTTRSDHESLTTSSIVAGALDVTLGDEAVQSAPWLGKAARSTW